MTLLDVSLDGVRAGQLEQRPGGTLSFTYDADYASRPSPTPLSLSMPLSARRHGSRVVSAWLEGLLPDNLAVREEWGRRFQVSARNPFALLRQVGRDAAGAVQVLPVDVDPPDAAERSGDVRRLSEGEVCDMLLALTAGDQGWQVGTGSGRWSLAGAQNKVALHRLDDGVWGVPNDSTPTTHVLKPTSVGTRFADLHVNEFVCGRAAGLLGLRVAHVDLVDFGGAKTLVSTRYDRPRDPAGAWLRLHQEDLLQTMSYPSSKKYRADGARASRTSPPCSPRWVSPIVIWCEPHSSRRSRSTSSSADRMLTRRTTHCSCVVRELPWPPSTTPPAMRRISDVVRLCAAR